MTPTWHDWFSRFKGRFARPQGGFALDGDINRLRRSGWLLIGIFLGGGLVWSATTKLEGAAIAFGTVGVESNRKSVAHLEGGIVQEILVREGDHVSAGQTLIRMGDTVAQATLDLLQSREDTLMAKKARLETELQGQKSIRFPVLLKDRVNEPQIRVLLDGEQLILQSRRDNLRRQDQILQERIAKKNNEISGLKAKRKATLKRLSLLGEEAAMFAKLLKKGLITKNKVLAVERKIAGSEGDSGDLKAQIARAGEEISELNMQRALSREAHLKDVTQDLQAVRARLSEIKEKVHAALDVLDRTDVKAPQTGTVVGLRVHTQGGIVRAGDPLLDLVPDNDRHIVELRIDPKDIDVVYPGMPAKVRLTAFNARTTPMLEGRVSHISADRLIDPESGIAYFTGRVLPDADSPHPRPKMTPGMQAEVMLVTAQRSVLDYLLEPLTRSLNRAGREL